MRVASLILLLMLPATGVRAEAALDLQLRDNTTRGVFGISRVDRSYLRVPTLMPGQTVRVTTLRNGTVARATHAGVIDDLGDNALLLRISGTSGMFSPSARHKTIHVRFAEIDRVEVRQKVGSHFLQGFLFGGFVGGILGARAGDTDSNHPVAPVATLTVTTLGVVLGLAVGGALGASIPEYNWYMVSPDAYQSSVGSTAYNRRGVPAATRRKTE